MEPRSGWKNREPSVWQGLEKQRYSTSLSDFPTRVNNVMNGPRSSACLLPASSPPVSKSYQTHPCGALPWWQKLTHLPGGAFHSRALVFLPSSPIACLIHEPSSGPHLFLFF